VPEGQREGLRFPWSRSERRVPRLVVRPLQSFLSTEVASGILVLAAALIALIWANSPWSGTYERLWETELTLGLGGWTIQASLQEWVNEGLMSLFFFVAALEIKRELITGELRVRRTAVLPVIAAIGGMAVPALLYLAVNPSLPEARGWAIPMATDIPFVLGVLALAGPGVPATARLFLLAMAIVDDLGSILLIAVAYRSDIDWPALAAAGGALAAVVLFRALEVRLDAVYVLLGVTAWVATRASGLSATVAGVAMAVLTPAVAFQHPAAVSDEARRVAERTVDDPDPPDADAHLWLRLAGLSRETVSPLARLEALLHPWASYAIVPLFALANTGIALSASAISEAAQGSVAWGVILGRVVGKPIGISLAVWLAVRAGIGRLPSGLSWRVLPGAAMLAGMGFTVALFVTSLAFPTDEPRQAATLAILAGSVLAGAMGAVLLRRLSREPARR
jgi:NhaA family Na+:H+ antiporter